MPAAWGAVAAAAIPAVTSGITALTSSDSSQKAAGQQVAGADQAAQVQRDEFNQVQSNLSPWMNIGSEAAQALRYFTGIAGFGDPNGPNNFGGVQNSPLLQQASMSGYQASPWYQAAMAGQQRGTDALVNRASSMGGPLSGNTLLALQNYGQQSALQGYGSYATDFASYQQRMYNMLAGLSGSGQNAATGLGGFGAGMANAVGSDLIGAGNARAAGTVGSANALAGGINGIGNAAGNYLAYNQMMNNQNGGGGGGGGGFNPASYGYTGGEVQIA